LENLAHILDFILYILSAINVLYLLVYSLASLYHRFQRPSSASEYKRIAILIPAYREDAVIRECVRSCLAQQYPSDSFEIVVISDSMEPETNASLSLLPIRLVQVSFKKSTKAKALNAAMAIIGDDYDIALILDADNIIPFDYLSDINNMFAQSGVEIVQTHRIAKNLNNHMALLDAVSEEINNSIFRLGHANLGMSAALIGSGMAFRYSLFRDTMSSVHAVGGFDRELELKLLYQRKFFYYLPYTHVQDEKVQTRDDFSRQRRRWLSAQWYYCCAFVKYIPKAFVAGKWDFCDKMYQQLSCPRLLLIGLIFILAILLSFFRAEWSYKWWILLCVLTMALLISIPRRYYSRQLLSALRSLPYAFYLMAKSLFRIRGANNDFIHTLHGTCKQTEEIRD